MVVLSGDFPMATEEETTVSLIVCCPWLDAGLRRGYRSPRIGELAFPA